MGWRQRLANAPGEDRNRRKRVPDVRKMEQRLANAPGEDRNVAATGCVLSLIGGSAWPTRQARIATTRAGTSTTAHRSSAWPTRQARIATRPWWGPMPHPAGQRLANAPGEDRNAWRVDIDAARALAAPGQRARRGSQQQRDLHDWPLGSRSAWPTRQARIATVTSTGMSPRLKPAAPGQRARRGSQLSGWGSGG